MSESEREKNKTMAVIEKRERKVVCYQGQGHSDVSYNKKYD